jgi:hypothetical protein
MKVKGRIISDEGKTINPTKKEKIETLFPRNNDIDF